MAESSLPERWAPSHPTTTLSSVIVASSGEESLQRSTLPDVADFDFRGRQHIAQRKKTLEKGNEAYLEQHPELHDVLHDALKSMVVNDPDDTLGYLQSVFKDM